MIKEDAAIVVLDAGFAGSLIAMLLRKIGQDPILIVIGVARQ